MNQGAMPASNRLSRAKSAAPVRVMRQALEQRTRANTDEQPPTDLQGPLEARVVHGQRTRQRDHVVDLLLGQSHGVGRLGDHVVDAGLVWFAASPPRRNPGTGRSCARCAPIDRCRRRRSQSRCRLRAHARAAGSRAPAGCDLRLSVRACPGRARAARSYRRRRVRDRPQGRIPHAAPGSVRRAP